MLLIARHRHNRFMDNVREFIVGGEKRTTGQVFEVIHPYNGSRVAMVCRASENDLDDAIISAEKGFGQTRSLPVYRRYEILKNLHDLIVENRKELSATITSECGKTRRHADIEVERAAENVMSAAEEARRINGEILPLDWNESSEGRTGYVRRFPVGIVLAITPFNFPLNLVCHKIAPAVAAGNAIIVKPSSKTPLSAILLGELLIEAGFPGEALSVIPCLAQHAEALVMDDRIRFLSFTGSAEVGWRLKGISGRKKVGLELGGNAAVIVHNDADLDYAAERIVAGGFGNAGQVCISVQRVFIHEPVYEELEGRISELTSALVPGDPAEIRTDVGPMISREAALAAYAKVEDALKEGAIAIAGGNAPKGTMMEPTILTGTTPEMEVNSTEIFAPVITLAPYHDFDDALRMANNSKYGLAAGVFTKDITRIMKAFYEIEAGSIQINDIPGFRADQMPYGGLKMSGTGREGPRYAIEEMTERKIMVINGRGAPSVQ